VVKAPLIWFRSCEVQLDLEGVRNGVFDYYLRIENGRNDERLRDGSRRDGVVLCMFRSGNICRVEIFSR